MIKPSQIIGSGTEVFFQGRQDCCPALGTLAILVAEYLLVLETIVSSTFFFKICSKIKKVRSHRSSIEIPLRHQDLRPYLRNFFHVLYENKYRYILEVELLMGQIQTCTVISNGENDFLFPEAESRWVVKEAHEMLLDLLHAQ